MLWKQKTWKQLKSLKDNCFCLHCSWHYKMWLRTKGQQSTWAIEENGWKTWWSLLCMEPCQAMWYQITHNNHWWHHLIQPIIHLKYTNHRKSREDCFNKTSKAGLCVATQSWNRIGMVVIATLYCRASEFRNIDACTNELRVTVCDDTSLVYESNCAFRKAFIIILTR